VRLQVGRALADEVAASSLQPMSTTSSTSTSRPPTLAAMVTTESLESAAEKADKGKAPPEAVGVPVARGAGCRLGCSCIRKTRQLS